MNLFFSFRKRRRFRDPAHQLFINLPGRRDEHMMGPPVGIGLAGAVNAAVFLASQQPGMYDMSALMEQTA